MVLRMSERQNRLAASFCLLYLYNASKYPIQGASSSAKHKSEAKGIVGSSPPCSIGPPIAPSEGIATVSGTCGDHISVKSILAIDASAANVQNSRAVESTLEVQQKSSQTCTASPKVYMQSNCWAVFKRRANQIRRGPAAKGPADKAIHNSTSEKSTRTADMSVELN